MLLRRHTPAFAERQRCGRCPAQGAAAPWGLVPSVDAQLGNSLRKRIPDRTSQRVQTAAACRGGESTTQILLQPAGCSGVAVTPTTEAAQTTVRVPELNPTVSDRFGHGRPMVAP